MWRHSRHVTRLLALVLLLAALTFFAAVWTTVRGAVPEGEWLLDAKAAVQIFACDGLLCGRIIWLRVPRIPEDRPGLDQRNPNPAMRQRLRCGLTVLWGLRALGPDRWGAGWFYNPDDGKTYSVSAQLTSPDVLTARIYVGIPLFGETKTLVRVPYGTTPGWC